MSTSKQSSTASKAAADKAAAEAAAEAEAKAKADRLALDPRASTPGPDGIAIPVDPDEPERP